MSERREGRAWTPPDRGMAISAGMIGVPLDEYRAREEAGLKWCTGHKAWHDRDEFGVRLMARDGLNNVCRELDRARSREGMRRRNVRRKGTEAMSAQEVATSDDAEWITIREFTARYGYTQNGIRQAIEEGRIDWKVGQGPRGPIRLVRAPASDEEASLIRAAGLGRGSAIEQCPRCKAPRKPHQTCRECRSRTRRAHR